MKKLISLFLLAAAFIVLSGFNLDKAIIPRGQILSGGPPKDGIPAILNPKFIPPEKAFFLRGEDKVIGVQMGNEAKAYPLKILTWHEVINDTIKGVPIVVTF